MKRENLKSTVPGVQNHMQVLVETAYSFPGHWGANNHTEKVLIITLSGLLAQTSY